MPLKGVRMVYLLLKVDRLEQAKLNKSEVREVEGER